MDVQVKPDFLLDPKIANFIRGGLLTKNFFRRPKKDVTTKLEGRGGGMGKLLQIYNFLILVKVCLFQGYMKIVFGKKR